MHYGWTSGIGQVVWIDNLFTSARLLIKLRLLGISAAGTVQTTKTKQEEVEEATQIKTRYQTLKCIPEPNHRLNQSIADIKFRYNTKIPWGTLYAEIAHAEPSVIQFAWKDSNVILFMSTVYNSKDTIKRIQTRPKNNNAITKRI